MSANCNNLRWGVLGAGPDAAAFVEALRRQGGQVVAVGSDEPGTATSFARPFGIHRAYGGYAGVIEDPAVDAVFVALPDARGRGAAALARAAGKPVLIGEGDLSELRGRLTALTCGTTTFDDHLS